MKQILKYRLKRFIVWLRLKLRGSVQNLITDVKIDRVQQLAFTIVKKAISHNEAELLIAPLSGTHYIQFREVYIRFIRNHFTIINGSYSYHVFLPDSETEILVQKFNARLEFNRKKFERAIMSKTERTLMTILNELNEEC